MKRDAEDEPYEGTARKRRNDRPVTPQLEPQPRAQRQSAAECNKTLKEIAAGAKTVSPVKKFPSAKHIPGSMAALKESQRERAKLAKVKPDEVQQLVETSQPTKQDALLASPAAILAQSNAHNITVHKLVEENARLKTANAELANRVKKEADSKSKADKRNRVLQDRLSVAHGRISDVEDDLEASKNSQQKLQIELTRFRDLASQNSGDQSTALKRQIADAETAKNAALVSEKACKDENAALKERFSSELDAIVASRDAGIAANEKLMDEVKAKQALVDRYVERLGSIMGLAKDT